MIVNVSVCMDPPSRVVCEDSGRTSGAVVRIRADLYDYVSHSAGGIHEIRQ